MSGEETISVLAFALDNINFYPTLNASALTFNTTAKTIVRVWDAFGCRDQFQILLNNVLLPVQLPANTFPLLFPDEVCPFINQPGNVTFRTSAYAWSEFILDNPSEWSMFLFMRLLAGPILIVGNFVQMFIQTIPFIPPSSCPFS